MRLYLFRAELLEDPADTNLTGLAEAAYGGDKGDRMRREGARRKKREKHSRQLEDMGKKVAGKISRRKII